jgi:hypothetical protein
MKKDEYIVGDSSGPLKESRCSSRRIDKPSWKKDNSREFLVDLGISNPSEIQRRNNDLKAVLESYGWKYRECVNIYEHGPTWYFRKTNKGVGLQKPILSLGFHWDNCGGEPFYVGQLYGFFDFMPNDKSYHPNATLEIQPILDQHINYLPILEGRIEHGLRYLTVIG